MGDSKGIFFGPNFDCEQFPRDGLTGDKIAQKGMKIVVVVVVVDKLMVVGGNIRLGVVLTLKLAVLAQCGLCPSLEMFGLMKKEGQSMWHSMPAIMTMRCDSSLGQLFRLVCIVKSFNYRGNREGREA